MNNSQTTQPFRNHGRPVSILMAEDDPDDRVLSQDALYESCLPGEIKFVCDGVELLDYLRHEGKYANHTSAPRPGLILLDLNMPRKDGREALKEIKDDAALRHIPIVVLTTSDSQEDIAQTYDLGVNSFIVKPGSFESLVGIFQTLVKYWFDVAELPSATPPKIPT